MLAEPTKLKLSLNYAGPADIHVNAQLLPTEQHL